jgi:hypothetical protein
MPNKTKAFTDANGTRYTMDAETGVIFSSMDRSGFLYDSEGKRKGHVNGDAHYDGVHY